MGKRENVDTTVDGRVMFDLLPCVAASCSLLTPSPRRPHTEFAATHATTSRDTQVHVPQPQALVLLPEFCLCRVPGHAEGGRAPLDYLGAAAGHGRRPRRLAVYCIKDSYFVIRLMWKLAVLINYIEMARVCGVPLDYLLNRGQQIKVFSMLLRRCRAENLLVPNLAKHGNNEDVKFEGATVIEPKRAFYEEPIATLDFASLYPSIMQAYNLCYSTLISKTDAERQFPGGSGTAYKPSPQCVDGVHHFVTASTRRGILPRILEDLLAARKRAKADMKKATDPMEKAVRCAASFFVVRRRHRHTETPSTRRRRLHVPRAGPERPAAGPENFGQLRLRLYRCCCWSITVPAHRVDHDGLRSYLLLRTREFVESTYTIANGYPANAEVVYGDTDSVMVNFGFGDVAETLPKAEKVAEEVTKIFPAPVKLEFEKGLFSLLTHEQEEVCWFIMD